MSSTCGFTPRRLGLLLCLVIVAQVGWCQQEPTREISAEEFLRWARRRAVPIALDATSDPAPLRVLDAGLRGKRVVMIGEPDHYIAEKVDVQLLLIRFLHARGWRTLGPEGVGPFTAMRLNRFLETGDARLPGSPENGQSGARSDRGDAHRSLRRDPEFAKRTASQQRWLHRRLRALNRGRNEGERPLRMIGFDVDHSPWTGYGLIDALLEPRRATDVGRELARRLDHVRAESVSEEIVRLRSAQEWMRRNEDACVATYGKDAFSRLRRYVSVLADSYDFYAALRRRGSHVFTQGLRRREITMMRRMRECLDLLPDGERVVLLGHNFHVGKDSVAMVRGGKPLWRSIGTRLHDAFPGEVYAVWLLYDHGHHLSLDGDVVQRVRSDSRSLEHLLAKVGPRFVLPLGSGDPAEDYLADYRRVRFNARPLQAVVSRNADAIVFVREATATRERS